MQSDQTRLEFLEETNKILERKLDQMKLKAKIHSHSHKWRGKELNRLINEGNSKEIEKVEAMPMASAATPEHNQQQLQDSPRKISTDDEVFKKPAILSLDKTTPSVVRKISTSSNKSANKSISSNDSISSTHVIRDSVPGSPQSCRLEGLPHLVEQGFQNIPHGFASPNVIRRQQLNETSQLIAAAMSKKNNADQKNGTEVKRVEKNKVRTKDIQKKRESLKKMKSRRSPNYNALRSHVGSSEPELQTANKNKMKANLHPYKKDRKNCSLNSYASMDTLPMSTINSSLPTTQEQDCKIQ